MKNLILILCVVLCSLASYGCGITVAHADYLGSRTVGGGITGSLSIDWTITLPNDVYYYSFYFFVSSNALDFILFEIGQSADNTVFNIGSLVYAYNTGLGTEPSSPNFIPWIPVPGAVPVPEPITSLVLSSFLTLIGLARCSFMFKIDTT